MFFPKRAPDHTAPTHGRCSTQLTQQDTQCSTEDAKQESNVQRQMVQLVSAGRANMRRRNITECGRAGAHGPRGPATRARFG